MTNLTIKIFLKYSWVFLFNIILILYSSELLLTIFLQPQVNSYIDLDYLRYQKAKELGADFDKRTYYQAFFEEKKTNLLFHQDIPLLRNIGLQFGLDLITQYKTLCNHT